MNDNIIVIYHGNCADGFTAAWLVNLFHSKRGVPDDWVIAHHAATYNEDPPDVLGRTVYIVDFSYHPAAMRHICEQAEAVIWIDHHASAIDAMTGFTHPKLRQHTSIERSGAYLTSTYLWPHCDPQDLVRLVDDRDRWVFQYPETKAFHAGLFSRPYKIGEWNKVAHDCAAIAAEGEGILRKHWKDIRELLDVMTEHRNIAGTTVPVANLAYTSASDACHELLERNPDAPFAACWFKRKDGKMVFSLRSRNGSDVDVSRIAKTFGGGGHKHAAGFAVVEWPGVDA